MAEPGRLGLRRSSRHHQLAGQINRLKLPRRRSANAVQQRPDHHPTAHHAGPGVNPAEFRRRGDRIWPEYVVRLAGLRRRRAVPDEAVDEYRLRVEFRCQHLHTNTAVHQHRIARCHPSVVVLLKSVALDRPALVRPKSVRRRQTVTVPASSLSTQAGALRGGSQDALHWAASGPMLPDRYLSGRRRARDTAATIGSAYPDSQAHTHTTAHMFGSAVVTGANGGGE